MQNKYPPPKKRSMKESFLSKQHRGLTHTRAVLGKEMAGFWKPVNILKKSVPVLTIYY